MAKDSEWYIFEKLIEGDWLREKMTPIHGEERAERELEKWKLNNPGIVARVTPVPAPRQKQVKKYKPKYQK